jgi:hypothetical protein
MYEKVFCFNLKHLHTVRCRRILCIILQGKKCLMAHKIWQYRKYYQVTITVYGMFIPFHELKKPLWFPLEMINHAYFN